MNKILWLASWYPNKLLPFNGDFIKRHAEAAAIYQPVHVIYMVKDEHKLVTNTIAIEEFTSGNLTECIAYYSPWKTGIKIFDRFISVLTYLKLSRKLILSFINTHGTPALVHVHVAMWAGVAALWLKRKYKIPFMVSEHWTGYYENSADPIYRKGWLFTMLTRTILKATDRLLPVCHQLGKYINDHIAGVSFQVIPNVVDTRLFKLSGHENPAFRFVHVSSMNRNKNVEGLINTLSKLRAFNINWKIVIAGPATTDLINSASRLGLEDFIEWKGPVPYSAIAELMAASSALVLFSRSENMPCVILEALCCGLPVVATRVGGIPEIVNKTNGILVDSEDETQLLQALLELLQNHHSYNNTLIGQEAAEQYNYHTIGKKLADLYGAYTSG